MPYKIIIADDHPLFRAALRQAVTQSVDTVDILEADTIGKLQELVEKTCRCGFSAARPMKMPASWVFRSGLFRGVLPLSLSWWSLEQRT